MKERLIWLNSLFNSDFTLSNNKIYEIIFNLPTIPIYKNSNLKVITYIRDSQQSKPIIIKLKNVSHDNYSIFNSDKEGYPIIYANHSGVENMTFSSTPIKILPQQIQSITLRLDDNLIRNEGITPEENLIKTTNSSIPITINSKYQINYQDPVNLPIGTYNASFNNGNIYFNNVNLPRPWGAYFAEDWSGTTLLDSSGNRRHATTSGTIYSSNLSGNGANAPISFINGSSTSTVSFPDGSIPSNFTILSLTKYNGGTKLRILQARHPTSPSPNILFGHWSGRRGLVFYEGWKTKEESVGNVDEWLTMVVKSSGSTPNNILVDGLSVGTSTISGSTYNLGINLSTQWANEHGDWSFSCVVIWDTSLSDSQLFELNRIVKNYRDTGLSIKNQLWLNNDFSYPLIKNPSNITISPFVWYRFDNSDNLGLDFMSLHNLTNPNGVSYNRSNFIKGTGSASFDGINDYLVKDSSFNLNSKSWSICLWFRRDTNSRDDYLFELGSSYGAGTCLTCGYRGSNRITIANYFDDLDTSSTYADYGFWVHLCFTFLTGTKRATIYRNGVQIGQKNFTLEFNTNNNFRIGKLDTIYAKGLYDDFRIYEQELTLEQVNEIYNGRLAIYNPPSFILGLKLEDD